MDEKFIKAKRLHSACCGMENGKIYKGKKYTDHYISVELPDGSWTSDHYTAIGSDNPFFEIMPDNTSLN